MKPLLSFPRLAGALCALVLFIGPPGLAALEKLTPPANGGKIKVAVVLHDGATMIDFAGPWEVFQDVMWAGSDGNMVMPFELYTVSDSTEMIHLSAGMAVVPSYTFKDAPEPAIVIIGAQGGKSPEMLDWLRQQAVRADVVMAVCLGVEKLARAGLLDDKPATTHPDFLDGFARRFPKVKFVKARGYVQSDPVIISTSGGVTSGIDAALHVVERYFGREIAQRTADYLEYGSDGWKQP